MVEYEEESKKIEQQLIDKQEQEVATVTEELEKSLPEKPKDNVELLNLKKMEEQLAKQKE